MRGKARLAQPRRHSLADSRRRRRKGIFARRASWMNRRRKNWRSTASVRRGDGRCARRRFIYFPARCRASACSRRSLASAASSSKSSAPALSALRRYAAISAIAGAARRSIWRTELYASWKRGILVGALGRRACRGVRRRAGRRPWRRAPARDVSCAFRALKAPHVEVGFMRARAHDIVEIAACPVLAPGMAGALAAARALAAALRGSRQAARHQCYGDAERSRRRC